MDIMVNGKAVSWAGRKIILEEQVDSTNEAAKRAGDAGAEHGTVFRALRQTAGKGRRGRSWYSEEEGNLYFTILLRPTFAAQKASMLTLVMAFAVAKAIHTCTGLQAEIKWPNDIVVHGKKVCGILSEMKLEKSEISYCVIGVGINVVQKCFAEDIKDKASSLCLEAKEGIDTEELLQNILMNFEEEYELFEKLGSLEFMTQKYNALLVNKDRQVKVLDPKGAYEGIARGITENGELLVELEDGSLHRVYAGEVSVRGLYGYV